MHRGLAVLLLITLFSDISLINAISLDKNAVFIRSSHSQLPTERKSKHQPSLRLKGGYGNRVHDIAKQDPKHRSATDVPEQRTSDKANPSIADIHLSRKAFHILGGMYFAFLRNSYMSRDSFVKTFLGCGSHVCG
jgi:hypothetical protein